MSASDSQVVQEKKCIMYKYREGNNMIKCDKTLTFGESDQRYIKVFYFLESTENFHILLDPTQTQTSSLSTSPTRVVGLLQ